MACGWTATAAASAPPSRASCRPTRRATASPFVPPCRRRRPAVRRRRRCRRRRCTAAVRRCRPGRRLPGRCPGRRSPSRFRAADVRAADVRRRSGPPMSGPAPCRPTGPGRRVWAARRCAALGGSRPLGRRAVPAVPCRPRQRRRRPPSPTGMTAAVREPGRRAGHDRRAAAVPAGPRRPTTKAGRRRPSRRRRRTASGRRRAAERSAAGRPRRPRRTRPRLRRPPRPRPPRPRRSPRRRRRPGSGTPRPVRRRDDGAADLPGAGVGLVHHGPAARADTAATAGLVRAGHPRSATRRFVRPAVPQQASSPESMDGEESPDRATRAPVGGRHAARGRPRPTRAGRRPGPRPSGPSTATTTAGLPKRTPMAQLVPGGVDRGGTPFQRRTPEAVRGLLSAYHRGVQRGRQSTNPEDDPGGQQSSQAGKEHEA